MRWLFVIINANMKRIQIASVPKRLLSTFIDGIIVGGLICLFYFCVFTKVVANVHHYDQLNANITNEQNISNLYENGEAYNVKHPNAGEKELAPKVKYFYCDYLVKKETKINDYWYFTHILQLQDIRGTYKDEKLTVSELLEWNTNYTDYQHKINANQNDIDDFFRAAFGTCTSVINNYDPIKGAVYTMTWANLRALMYSSMIGTIIPCLCVPLLLPNGKTVGKLITKLVVLTDEGYEYKRWKLIIRYLAFYGVEVLGAFFTIGLTLILTSVTTLFSKKRRALHDFIAFSVVIDEPHSVFYKDEQEEEEYIKKAQEKLS